MTREQLLHRANRRAQARYGHRISKRMLEDWVHEEFVTGPVRAPHPGRRAARWEWSSRSYAQILQVCRERQRGAKTFDQLRIALWLRGLDPLTETIRALMLREYPKLYKRLFRPLRNDAGPPLIGDMASNRRQPSVERRRADQRLGAFEDLLPLGIKARAYDAMRFGAAFNIAPLIGLVCQLLDKQWDNDIGGAALDLRGVAQLAEGDDEPIPGSAEHSLAALGPDTFEKARQLFWLMRRGFLSAPKLVEKHAPALKELAASFHSAGLAMGTYPWNFGVYVFLLHGTRNARGVREVIAAMEILSARFLNGERPDGT